MTRGSRIPVQLCGYRVGKATVYLDLNLTRYVKGHKEGFCNYKNRKGNQRKCGSTAKYSRAPDDN